MSIASLPRKHSLLLFLSSAHFLAVSGTFPEEESVPVRPPVDVVGTTALQPTLSEFLGPTTATGMTSNEAPMPDTPSSVYAGWSEAVSFASVDEGSSDEASSFEGSEDIFASADEDSYESAEELFTMRRSIHIVFMEPERHPGPGDFEPYKQLAHGLVRAMQAICAAGGPPQDDHQTIIELYLYSGPAWRFGIDAISGDLGARSGRAATGSSSSTSSGPGPSFSFPTECAHNNFSLSVTVRVTPTREERCGQFHTDVFGAAARKFEPAVFMHAPWVGDAASLVARGVPDAARRVSGGAYWQHFIPAWWKDGEPSIGEDPRTARSMLLCECPIPNPVKFFARLNPGDQSDPDSPVQYWKTLHPRSEFLYGKEDCSTLYGKVTNIGPFFPALRTIPQLPREVEEFVSGGARSRREQESSPSIAAANEEALPLLCVVASAGDAAGWSPAVFDTLIALVLEKSARVFGFVDTESEFFLQAKKRVIEAWVEANQIFPRKLAGGHLFERALCPSRRRAHRALLNVVRRRRRRALLGVAETRISKNFLGTPDQRARYPRLFPHCDVIAHTMGSGTTSHALLAGKLQLYLKPRNHEHAPDKATNAMSVSRLYDPITPGKEKSNGFYWGDLILDAGEGRTNPRKLLARLRVFLAESKNPESEMVKNAKVLQDVARREVGEAWKFEDQDSAALQVVVRQLLFDDLEKFQSWVDGGGTWEVGTPSPPSHPEGRLLGLGIFFRATVARLSSLPRGLLHSVMCPKHRKFCAEE